MIHLLGPMYSQGTPPSSFYPLFSTIVGNAFLSRAFFHSVSYVSTLVESLSNTILNKIGHRELGLGSLAFKPRSPSIRKQLIAIPKRSVIFGKQSGNKGKLPSSLSIRKPSSPASTQSPRRWSIIFLLRVATYTFQLLSYS